MHEDPARSSARSSDRTRRRGNPTPRPPGRLRAELLEPGSLTRRVRKACPGAFEIVPVAQGKGRPTAEEGRHLDLRTRASALIREVHLCCREQPLVFARSVIPWRCLTGRWRRIARLGAKPLGEALFADGRVTRSHMEIFRARVGDRIHDRVVRAGGDPGDTVWGRRSVFHLPAGPILVAELFLPAFTDTLLTR